MPRVKTGKKLPRAKFDYSLNFKSLDMRKQPELYRIGLGEQGVLSVEPYKSEILPLWRFKTPDIAKISSQELRQKFYEYKLQQDFIGMDMTRKFIQMGVTRARRYANWSGGKKYTGKVDEHGKKVKVTKGPEDPVKAESARIFGVVLQEVQADHEYQCMAQEHRERHEAASSTVQFKTEANVEASSSTGQSKREAAVKAEEDDEAPSLARRYNTRASIKLEDGES